jgi:hypothetical protein
MFLWATEESANTENIIPEEVMPVVNITRESICSSTILDTLVRKESESSDSIRTESTAQPSMLINSGTSSLSPPEINTLAERPTRLSSLTVSPMDISRLLEEEESHRSQSLSRPNSSPLELREKSDQSEDLAR